MTLKRRKSVEISCLEMLDYTLEARDFFSSLLLESSSWRSKNKYRILQFLM